MARKTFFSFHYKPDCWRASQVRNMGKVEGNSPVSDNDWEQITKGGEDAVKKWIDGQLSGRSCTIVLIGAATAGRKWIEYEIRKSWRDEKGLVGIYVHNLKDSDGSKSSKGNNPFTAFKVGETNLSSIAKTYDPPYSVSTSVYDYIQSNLAGWVEEAVSIRQKH